MKTRDYAYCGLFGSLALALPALFHALGLAGAVFLPMYAPLAALAFLVKTRRAVLTAALVPFASSFLTGMPLVWPPLVAVLSAELAVQVAALGWLGRRFCGAPASRGGGTGRACAVLFAVLAAGRFLHAGGVWALARAFTLPAGVLAGGAFLAGWPGVLWISAVVSVFVGAVARRDGVCEVRFLRALRRLRLPEGAVLVCAQLLRWSEALARDAEMLARALELRRSRPPRAARAEGPVVALAHVRVTYPGASEPALDVASFTLAPGEKVALLGPNGAGKTTLLSLLAGFVPYAGEARVFGTRPGTRAFARERGRLGVLFENPDDQFLFPTLREDVGYALARQGLPADAVAARVDALLAAVGLEAGNRPIAALSRGQRQRAALAGLLAAEPELLLLDEPTAALDDAERARLADLLAAQKAALVVATHDRAFVARARLQSRTLDASGAQCAE